MGGSTVLPLRRFLEGTLLALKIRVEHLFCVTGCPGRQGGHMEARRELPFIALFGLFKASLFLSFAIWRRLLAPFCTRVPMGDRGRGLLVSEKSTNNILLRCFHFPRLFLRRVLATSGGFSPLSPRHGCFRFLSLRSLFPSLSSRKNQHISASAFASNLLYVHGIMMLGKLRYSPASTLKN